MTAEHALDPDHLSGYRGKRAVVVGCHSGIGHATARMLIDAGAEVHGLDWKPCDLPLAGFVAVDLREEAGIVAAIAATAGGRAPIAALFNCAGIPPGAPPLDVMKVNFIGTRLLSDGLAARMAPGGAIANVASTGGMGWQGNLPALRELVGIADFAAAAAWCAARTELVAEGYRFSKEAVIVWTLLQSAPLVRRGVRLNCTLPGAVQTPMLVEIEKVTPTAVIDQVADPFGRRSTPEEQARVLLFLNSAAAGYVSGAVVPVDGGFMATMATR